MHLYLMMTWFFVSMIIGLIGANRKLGFWGYFFASLALSPVLGLLLVFASDPKKKS